MIIIGLITTAAVLPLSVYSVTISKNSFWILILNSKNYFSLKQEPFIIMCAARPEAIESNIKTQKYTTVLRRAIDVTIL